MMPEDSLQIRLIQPCDNAAVAAIVGAGLDEFGIDSTAATAELSDMTRAYGDARSAYFVAVNTATILGGGGIGPLANGPDEVCELRKMYLRPEARGLGLGRKLVEACLQAAVERNYRECYLETMGAMARARRLYEGLGFVQVAQRRGGNAGSRCNIWYNKMLTGANS